MMAVNLFDFFGDFTTVEKNVYDIDFTMSTMVR